MRRESAVRMVVDALRTALESVAESSREDLLYELGPMLCHREAEKRCNGPLQWRQRLRGKRVLCCAVHLPELLSDPEVQTWISDTPIEADKS